MRSLQTELIAVCNLIYRSGRKAPALQAGIYGSLALSCGSAINFLLSKKDLWAGSPKVKPLRSPPLKLGRLWEEPTEVIPQNQRVLDFFEKDAVRFDYDGRPYSREEFERLVRATHGIIPDCKPWQTPAKVVGLLTIRSSWGSLNGTGTALALPPHMLQFPLLRGTHGAR